MATKKKKPDLNDGPAALLGGDGEAEHDSLRGAVAAVREHAHAHPVISRGAAEPGLHVVTRSLHASNVFCEL